MLFKILQGDSSRISADITPLHPGWCYFTSDDGRLYIDSADEDGCNPKRTCINQTTSGESRAVPGTLTKNGWVNGQQTLLIAGLTAEQNGIISLATNATDDQADAASTAKLRICAQTSGALTISASGDIPSCDIPITVILISS